MRRLGLAWRVTLIVIAALVAIQIIAAAAYYVQRGRATESDFRLPLPDQIAAIVQLVERTPADQRPLVLRVVNGAGLRVAIERRAPPEPEPLRRAPWIEAAVARYLDGSDASMVRAYYIGPERNQSALETFSFRPVRIVAPLAGGGVLVAETVDELTVRVLGLPPGFWAGIIGFAVAALALYAVVRETTPLARLARSVERFGEAIEPVSLPERGAREVRVLVLNALLGLGTVLAPVFVAIFDGLGFWWGLPLLSAILLVLLIIESLRLPLQTEARRTAEAPTRLVIPRRFWMYAGFAVLYGICETVNGNWAQLDMTGELGTSTTAAALALTAFWGMVTIGRVLFAAVQRVVSAEADLPRAPVRPRRGIRAHLPAARRRARRSASSPSASPGSGAPRCCRSRSASARESSPASPRRSRAV